MSEIGYVETSYTARGIPTYHVEISHDELNKYQIIKGASEAEVRQKAHAKMAEWDEMWERKAGAATARSERQRKAEEKALERQAKTLKAENTAAEAKERTEECEAKLAALHEILAKTLQIDDTVDWEVLKDLAEYPKPKPTKPSAPMKPTPPNVPKEIRPTDPAYKPIFGFLDIIFKSRRPAREKEAESRFNYALKQWQETKLRMIQEYNVAAKRYNTTIKEQAEKHKEAVVAWEKRRQKYIAKQDKKNAIVDKQKEAYLESEPDAVQSYCDIVLSRSEYPDYFPQDYELDYNSGNKILIVDYQLPPKDKIPTIKEVKYVKSKDEFSEKHISTSEQNKLYDSVLYQIALRTVHELYEADAVNALASIAFNGYVRSVDPATGNESNTCVLSLQVGKEEFLAINLANVAPKECFKKLKGVSSAKLHSITPVAPLLSIDKEDKRFVASHDVVDGIGAEDNLAAMDWEEFEHLIREVFEKEFTTGGGEVKVTQASRDGGVDAIAFDPDPIRGGKIVIQAKRYTGTVGVSAVRDLYGTVMNEGANKGILVTTSDYGPDAYEFARGKPLTLLTGGNLLHMLEKHGHKAKIDLKEAKKMLAEAEKQKG